MAYTVKAGFSFRWESRWAMHVCSGCPELGVGRRSTLPPFCLVALLFSTCDFCLLVFHSSSCKCRCIPGSGKRDNDIWKARPTPISFKGMTWKSHTSRMHTCCCPELGRVTTPTCKEGCEPFQPGSQMAISYPQNTLTLVQPEVQGLWGLQGPFLQA